MCAVKKNLDEINKEIKKACLKSGKNPEEITLVGVTKTVSVEKMKEASLLSINNFGENKVQELLSKHDFFEKSTKWHLIGHLQTNKVKYIIDKVVLIHSVDSFKLAEEINKRASERNITMGILIEINIGNEESKFGVSYDEILPLVEKIQVLENVKIKGIMTVAPFVSNPEDNRIHFRKMNQLFLKLKNMNNPKMSIEYLSMGMTNDYKVAIEEGSNMVRIGSGLFGERNYSL